MQQDQTSDSDSPFSHAFALFGERTEVIGIDIGTLPIAHGDCPVGIRVHVATPADVLRLHQVLRVPDDINGVRLMLLPTQYRTVASKPNKADPSAVTKYTIQAEGLGQLMNQILAKQHPLAGRNHTLIATSGSNGQVIAPTVASAASEILKTLEVLEESIKCTPDATAPILCYRIGHFNDIAPIELSITNAANGFKHTHSGTKFVVDGCGVYTHQSDKPERFVEGFRVIPAS
ncbi:hypothetical protein [Halioxenophilus aromaticivorans]|uniref:hypothetical protein n=1 Tax=Halioxenophilus aromaticivorans TaxID=1306992 RepID=UPI0031E6F0F9